MVGGQPVGGATMTLWRTAGEDAPESLREVSTDAGGGFARQLQVTGDIASAKDIDPARFTQFVNDLEMALEKPTKLTLSQLPTVTARSKNWSKQKQ